MVANEQDERTRLELERLRVEIERRRLMLDERRAELAPLFAGAEHSRELTHHYARIALQSLFLLNGGALIALPTFGQLLGTAFSEQLALAAASILVFVVGLVFAMLATLAAYLAMDVEAESVYYLAQVQEREYLNVQFPEQYDDETEAGRVRAQKMTQKRRKQFGRRKVYAITAGLCSLTAFSAASLLAANVLGLDLDRAARDWFTG